MSYLNGLVVFLTFFNLSLIFAIRSSWSEPQSIPGLVFADCVEFSIFGCKECNQFDFGIDHLVMSKNILNFINSSQSSKAVSLIYILVTMNESGSFCSPFSIVGFCFAVFSHSGGYVVSHHAFNLLFLMINRIEHLFISMVCHLYWLFLL